MASACCCNVCGLSALDYVIVSFIPRIDTTKKPVQNFSLRVLSMFWTPRLIGQATIPVILTAILLRWPPSLITTSDIDVLGEERGGKSDIEVEFDRVVENAYNKYRKFAEVASPVPRVNDYLRDVEFDWEKTIASWHNMIADARDTRIRPAPVVEQYWNAD